MCTGCYDLHWWFAGNLKCVRAFTGGMDEDIISRLSGRLECKECASTFHTEFRKPKTPGVCDNCGGELITRADDKPETVKSRLSIYHSQTEPLLNYYIAKGILKSVEGQDSIEDTTKEVLRTLEA